MTDHQRIIRQLFQEALEAAAPAPAVKRGVDERLRVDVRGAENLYILGAGKAGLPMLRALESSFQRPADAGSMAVPETTSRIRGDIELFEAGHPLPDEASLSAGERMLEIADSAGGEDIVICPISGGGSALAEVSRSEISLENIREITELLLNAGLSIHEINAVRRHLSLLKGGQLAKRAAPAGIYSLLVSDVVGDDISAIASGPTAPDPTTFGDALRVIRESNLTPRLPDVAVEILKRGEQGDIPETPSSGEPCFEGVSNRVILRLEGVLEDVQAAACRLVDFARIVDSGLQGQAREVGRRIGDFLAEEAERRDRTGCHCFLWGGEPSVTVAGSGKGGPTQELALAAGEQLAAKEPSTASVAVGALATDGIDGPTDAAGAIVGSNAISAGRRKGLDPREILENNDTYRFLDAVDSLVRIGPTETNVNDVVVGIVDYD